MKIVCISNIFLNEDGEEFNYSITKGKIYNSYDDLASIPSIGYKGLSAVFSEIIDIEDESKYLIIDDNNHWLFYPTYLFKTRFKGRNHR